MKKLVIIPAYNEMDSIVKTVHDIKENTKDFNYIIINDCSTDRTRQVCEEHNLRILNLPVNLGIGGAVQTGYLYAYHHGYDIAVQVDGDGQHDASYLDIMADQLVKEGLDMIIGSRFIDKEGFQSSGMRRVGIRYFTFLIKLLTRFVITDPTSGLRMVNKDIIELFAKDYPKDYPEPESVVAILRNKHKVKEIPVIMRERNAGVSSISMRRSIYYMIKVTFAIIMERIR